MGYSTDYNGELKFSDETTLKDVQRISQLLDNETSWDLEFTKSMDGICWNGCEKTYDLEKGVNKILEIIKEDNPKFDLIGELQFSGEEFADRGVFKKGEDGRFRRFMFVPSGKKHCCPECRHYFYDEEE